MNDLTEIVDLPDPAARPLVHPLDVPVARRDFRAAQVVGATTGPLVAACIGSAVWAATGSPVAPLLAAASTAALGALARRYHLVRAWDHVPRARQDRTRVLPLRQELAAAAVPAAALAGALALLVARFDDPQVPADVRGVLVGAGGAVALLLVADVLVRLLRTGRRAPGGAPGVGSRGGPRDALRAAPLAAVAVVAAAAGYAALADGAALPADALAWGAAPVLVVGAATARAWAGRGEPRCAGVPAVPCVRGA